MNSLSPRNLSLLLHGFLAITFLLITKIQFAPHTEQINIPIVYAPPIEPMNIKEIKKESKVVLKSINKADVTPKSSREVFGLNRNSYTDSSAGNTGIAVKMGNTIAKAADKEILKASDSDSLPTPTEEYLVSQMPRVLSEVRPVYPKAAKEKHIEGSVALSVLIDEKGNVRQVDFLDGEEIFKNEAIEAMRKFRFSPANVSGKNVAVKIRYVIHFKGEY
jgi:TonB family protein